MDIVESTARTNPARARLRQAMYCLLDEALTQSGIAERHRDRMVDRGDGALVIVHPVDQVPKTLLINAFIPALSELIAEHNADLAGCPLRLRASLHAGEIHYDSRGPFGEALDITCRLVDAPELKDAARHTSAPLVLAVSDHIFQSVIRHRYSGIDDDAYLPLVRMDIGGHDHRGWIYVPAEPLPVFDVHQRRCSQ
ncbi:MAG TPA: hypothetical protein VGX25_23105 [Actinophytocola sp.]|uniref:hypothetical protein n=1 Tax=Actinophytocola sp. TaxID=1872138 RepID=UPI002DDD4BEA|nr:hypothetical protein [Actinophytocola sp.]HEV2782290.1 hypothetical protein [Actinophytocola sp.]